MRSTFYLLGLIFGSTLGTSLAWGLFKGYEYSGLGIFIGVIGCVVFLILSMCMDEGSGKL